jgi:thiosulfate dehydrogenase
MRRVVVMICVLLLVSTALALAEEKGKMKADSDQEMKSSCARGKALFMDTSLGTNGMSCNSCHAGGGTKAGKMGDTEIPPFAHVGRKYPMYSKMAGKVVTLDQVINSCITNAMKGTALAWNDQKLADLTVYTVSVNAKMDDKPESMEKEKTEKETKTKEMEMKEKETKKEETKK